VNAWKAKLGAVKLDLKRLAAIATIGLLLGLGYALWQAGQENIPPPSDVQTLEKGRAEGRRGRFASWEFVYERATTLQDQVTTQIDGIHDGVYWKDGKALVHMRAQMAIYNNLTHDFSVSGPMHLDVDDHGKIRTFDADAATWTDATQTLHIPGPATVGSRHGARLVLSNVTVDFRSGRYTIGKIEGGATP
jgi:hypothetical protein